MLIDLADNPLTAEAAGTLIGVGRRQVYRLRRAFASAGPTALVSRRRGRASNRRHRETFRQTPRDRRYEWAYLFGAICPERRTGAAIIMPEVKIEAMNEHLAEISRRVSVGAIALLVLV